MNHYDSRIILLFPHIDGNRTSLARFESFIEVLINNNYQIKIINFSFPASGNTFLGIDTIKLNHESIAEKYKSNVIQVETKLNFLQKIFFTLANKVNRTFLKPLLWVHQILYQNDIFTPKIDSNFYNLLNINQSEQINGLVIAFGGPFGIFSIADKIADKYNFKLVLDYRDPWTFGYAPIDGILFIHQLKSFLKRKVELKFLYKSSLIITVSNSLKNFFPEFIQKKVIVLENGSNFTIDENDIISHPKTFNIIYAGTIYNSQLQDKTFFIALNQFLQTVDSNNVKLYFLGSKSNKNLFSLLKFLDLEKIAVITSRLSNQELYNYFVNASLFLHLKYGKNKAVITSKQADYLLFKKNILLPVSDEGDLKFSIENNNAGKVCYSQQEIVKYLSSLYHAQFSGNSMKINSEINFNNNRIIISNEFIKHINTIVDK